jgi:hypothetical protein
MPTGDRRRVPRRPPSPTLLVTGRDRRPASLESIVDALLMLVGLAATTLIATVGLLFVVPLALAATLAATAGEA